MSIIDVIIELAEIAKHLNAFGQVYKDITEVTDEDYDVLMGIISFLKDNDPVEVINTVKTNNHLGVNGVLITGECPVCGQKQLNNRDNAYCGACGRELLWEKTK